MDFHGNINLKDNEMQKLIFQQETDFPVDAVTGSVVFKGNVLYMSVAVGNDLQPVWIPLTASIDTYVHTQSSAATTWTISHALGDKFPMVQVYDDNHEMIIPDSIVPDNTTTLAITFSTAVSGVAVVMHGDEIPANGIGIIEPSISNAFNDISELIFNSRIDVTISPFLNQGIGNAVFSTDGTIAFMSNDVNNKFSSYSLSTAWDLTTASLIADVQLTSTTLPKQGALFISPDGTKMVYKLGNQAKVGSFNLSIPYDITTLSSTGNFTPPDNSTRGIGFSPDGLKMYFAANNGKRVYQFSLSSPYVVNTQTQVGSIILTEFAGKEMYGLAINTDGTRLLILQRDDDSIYQYTFGTAFDITTLSYDNVKLTLSNQVITPTSLFISADGLHLFVSDIIADVIDHYSI